MPRVVMFLIPFLVILGNLVGLGFSVICEADHILCKNTNKCTRISYICDSDNDCGDNSDESFCPEWRNTGCSDRGMAKCTRNGVHNCISIASYCSASPPCTGIVDPRICVMMRNGAIQPITSVIVPATTAEIVTEPITTPLPTKGSMDDLQRSELLGDLFAETLNKTMEHDLCPTLYTRVGDYCLSFFYILKVSWGEARQFCELIGGQLLSLSDNIDKFVHLQKHLRAQGITSDFWVGGRYVNDTEGWTWLTDDALELGSTFWAIRHEDSCRSRAEEYNLNIQYWLNDTACYHYQQAPRPDTNNHCTALTYKHYHYMTDENCMSLRSPLCLAVSNGTGLKV